MPRIKKVLGIGGSAQYDKRNPSKRLKAVIAHNAYAYALKYAPETIPVKSRKGAKHDTRLTKA